MIMPSVAHIYEWFENYIRSNIAEEMLSNQMILIKIEHSRNVASNCGSLASDLAWPDDDRAVGEILGLLHDIGRFSQYVEYGTFADTISINHGERGYGLVSESGILESLSERYRSGILDGIRHHNLREISRDISPESLPFLKLLRDADKLDIYRIITDAHADNKLEDRLKSALDIRSEGPVNPNAVDDIRRHETVSNANVVSRIDFHLMQISWVFDINYRPTFERLLHEGYIKRIIGFLPEDPDLDEVSGIVETHLESHAAGCGNPQTSPRSG